MLTCALTGHRVLGKDFPAEGTEKKLRTLLENGTDTFLCGMALGFDLLCGEMLARLKKEFPLRLVACVPCADQSGRYPFSEKKRYAALLERCDEQVVLHKRYETGCMFERNRYMVDRCDMVLAYLRGACEKGGTYYTVRYAQKTGKPVLYV